MATRVGHPGSSSSRLAERFCPRCGHRGPELQGPRGVSVFVCNSCGEDLYSRPARTYLEMEGIVDEREEILRFVALAKPGAEQRATRRFWTDRRVRTIVLGMMLGIASVGFFLLVSLAAVAVLSS